MFQKKMATLALLVPIALSCSVLTPASAQSPPMTTNGSVYEDLPRPVDLPFLPTFNGLGRGKPVYFHGKKGTQSKYNQQGVHLEYYCADDAHQVLGWYQNALKDQGWTMPPGSVTETQITGTKAKEGYSVTVTCYPTDARDGSKSALIIGYTIFKPVTENQDANKQPRPGLSGAVNQQNRNNPQQR